MKKLLELLNEYRTEKGERNLNESEVSQTLDSLNYLRLFVEWLVDNDKIGIPTLVGRLDEYETVLCDLAISSTPIETLISYLR